MTETFYCASCGQWRALSNLSLAPGSNRKRCVECAAKIAAALRGGKTKKRRYFGAKHYEAPMNREWFLNKITGGNRET